MKKNYYIFDVIKFILCLLVVQIHIGFFNSYSLNLDFVLKNWLSRFAVPLFFMMSSFLLFVKVDNDDLFSQKNVLIYKKYFYRLLKLYSFWWIIYCLVFKFVLNYNITIFSSLLSFFIGFYRQFWFIPVQLIGTFLLLCLLRYFSLKKIIIISIFLYCIGLILVPYNSIFCGSFDYIPVFDGDISLCRNAFSFGLLFISLGAYYGFYFKQGNKIIYFIFSILFLILSYLEFSYLKYINCPYYAVQIFVAFFCYSFFGFILNLNLKYKKIYSLLRFYSIQIYCLHTLIYLLLEKLAPKYSVLTNSIFMYFSVIFLCLFISSFYYRLKKYIN